MKLLRRKSRRYVARDLDWRPILGVATGVVEDTRPDLPSRLDRTGPGWEHVTTLSRARSIARWANRHEIPGEACTMPEAINAEGDS